MNQNMNRRQFLGTTAIAGAGASLTLSQVARAQNADQTPGAGSGDKPALLGGQPVRTRPPHKWPVIDEREDKAMLETVRSGKWFRGNGPNVAHFEQAYAKATGAKNCVATNSGTSALFSSLAAVGVSAGDEVIVAPYTFIATVNVILLHHALPIFVDTDPETLQIDARKIEAAITERTTAIIPVHLGGSAADLDAILAVAKKHKLPVVEDACQSHLGQWRGRALGTWGDTGCFSFQASKNLNCGDGGAVITNNDEWADKVYSFHNNCRARQTSSNDFVYKSSRGGNFRMTEFQAAILLAQMTRLEDQMKTREQNAAYLRGLLKEIPGIVPARMYDG
jgi:dTDP-4-amino-4,6-dideoxygalactose transaminase